MFAKRGSSLRSVRFINSPRAQRIIMITIQSSLIFHYDIWSGLAHKSTTDYLTKTNFEKVYVPCSSRSEFIISSRAKRAQCVNCVLVLASWKLAALIFTCIYPMVSAMKSYNGLTSRRISVSRQRSTKSDFEFPSMTNGIHEVLWFHRLQNNVYYRWISSHFSCKQNSKHKNAELSILAGEDLTPKNPLERERRLEIQRRKQQRWRRHQQTAEQREHHTMNFEC